MTAVDPQPDDRDIEDLIEASSLGTPGAKRLRARTSPEVARRVVARSKEMAALDRPRSTESADPAEPVDLDTETGTDDLSGSR